MTARRPGAPRRAGRPASSSGAPAAPAARRRSTPAAPRPRDAARPRRTPVVRPATEDGPVWGLTRRALVLIALVVIALATLVPTLNSYVSQRQQLAQARADVAQRQAEVDDMRAQVDRWEDPAYVAAQARERLLFAMPGETQYRLTDTSGRDVPMTAEQRVEAAAARGDWYDRLWTSVEGSSRLTPSDIPDAARSTAPGATPSAAPAPSPTEEPTP